MAAAPTLVSHKVEPSASDLITSLAPMAPLAPGLFSTITVLPKARPKGSASVRAMASTGPPAAKATMIRTGLVLVCAMPRPQANVMAEATASVLIKLRIFMNCLLFDSITAGCHAAIHHNFGARNELCVITGQKQSRTGRIAAVAHKAQRNPLDSGI